MAPQVFTLTSLNGVRRRQDLGQNGIEDMIQLSDLNEASLLWNLKIRYDKELIYTYVGSILVAVNPYKMFDIYGLDMVKKYENQILGTLSPHLFAIGSSAYAALNKTGESQVVVISGESGAGKTESTKLVMQYLAAVNKSPSNLVTEQILEASPLLESFGNAKTVRNDNSSRFGKYLEVHFNKGVIIGAKVTEYLLEKSRIVTQAAEERNYHVFYEMLLGLPESQRQSYGLLTPEKYFYLNQGGNCEIDGKVDRDDFQSLLSAMQVLGFTNDEQDTIFRILASVLHLGNVYFHRKQLRHGQEGVEIGSDAEIKWTAHLLKLNADGIKDALMTKTTEARGERVQTPLTIDQSLDARDAFAKALYHTLFSWLVARINQIVYKGTKRTAAISILDIFGFEDFQENSFEQLCINYANENLQFYFNKHIFKLEQMEYAKEKIHWQTITYTDNVPIINLIAKKPVGILHLLDDESNFPKATDVSFLEKCHYNHALDELYSRPRMSSSEFGLKHYAGQVWYNVDGFLDKNRDTLRSDVVELLISSKIKLISTMFENYRNVYESTKTINKANGRFVTMKPRTPTIAARFHDSLQQLLALMDKCNPWFVRCIKPNNDKAPMKFDMPIVVEQLRYTGMLETIRIRKTGYPIRLKFSQFYDRYRYFLPDRGATVARGTPYRELCRFIFEIKECNSNDYQLGTTRVFLRENLEREFEKERSEILHKAALTLQTNVRGYLARRKYHNIKRSTIKLQSAVRGWRERKKYKIIRRGIIATQAKFRGKRQRKRYLELSTELKRRAAAEKAARDRAKVKAQKEEQERASRAVAGVNHLEIPAELAFIFSKLEDWEQTHNERNLVKVVGNVSTNPRKFYLPQDIDHHAFTKFTNIYFKSHVWGMKREPIKTPFLAKAKDMDYQDSLALFKLILRFMNDNNLNGKKESVLGDYIVNKGLCNEKLRDEIFCQLCNQTWNNTNDANNERGWLLMANCISVFPPSHTLHKYLLKYVSDHAYDGYKALCQRKLLQIQSLELPLARCYPPNILEWRSNRKRVNMALPLHFADGETTTVEVDSWSTGEDLAGYAIRTRGSQECNGWSVVLAMDDGPTKEAMGCDYVMDLISEMEIAPAFPVCKNSFLMSHDKNMSKTAMNDDLEVPIVAPRRPVNPPPQPPVRKQSRELIEETVHTPRKPANRIRSQSKDHTVESGLSRKSALNDRYFEDGRSRSLDNLLDPEVAMPYKMDNLGLSRSRLNDRYHSADKIPSSSSIIERRAVANQEYMSKSEILLEENLESVSQRGESHRTMELNGSTDGLNDNQSDVVASSNVNLDFDYQDIAARSEDDKGSYLKGHPRFIKSQYAGKRAAPGSHSSRAYIEKSDYAAKSSALSDTSEAPSLASHVRRVRVPSQASDVDQFLDDLFMPVLDGNLDELSDARSLAASIKGGGSKKAADAEDDPDDNEVATLTSTGPSSLSHPCRSSRCNMENVDDYITNLFQPIFVNESVNKLVSASTLAQKIKGGGRGVQDKSSSQPGFTPITNMTSPTTVMPGMMSPPPMMMPLFSPSAQSSASLSFMGPGGVTGGAQTMSTANFYPTSPDAVVQSAMLHSIPLYNIQGLNSHQNQQMDSNLLAYQQNLQRAFLQSAMAQNIQIQQQLLAQNQALQQLLQQQTGTSLKSQQQTPVSFGTEGSDYWRRDKDDQNPPVPPKTTRGFITPVQSTITAQIHREQSPLQTTYGIPAPPPLPPPPDATDPHNRPFIDPYGRAKTVRIGKWRWPPPQDGSQEGSDSFFQFKMRQQRKTTPAKQSSQQDSNEDRTEVIEWEEFEMNVGEKPEKTGRKSSAPVFKESKDHKSVIKSFELGAQRPSPGSIGKLRISSEMRHKLEMVTANHSVRSTAKPEKPSLSQVPNMAAPRKLEDNRRLLLEQQLAGRWGSIDSVDQVTRGTVKDDRPDLQSNIVRSQVERMEKTSPTSPTVGQNPQWRPNPPPAPVGPHHIDGPLKKPQPPSRSSSFYSTGYVENYLPSPGENLTPARDFVHQNLSHFSRVNPTARPRSPPPPIQPVKRNNFNGSSDIFGINSKVSFGHENYNGRGGIRREEIFDGSGNKKENFNNIRNREEMNNSDMRRSRESLYKQKVEMDRRSSVSEQIDRIEIEESSEFLQPMDIAPPTSIQRQFDVAETKLFPPSSAAYFTYNRVPWKLHVRKEVFSPNERLTNPLAVHLVFCQIVKDVFGSNCIRMTREQRADMKKLLDGYGITVNNLSSHNTKQTIKKNIVELAKEWDTYFCRLFPVSGGQTNRTVQYLGVSHSGLRLIRREKGAPQDYLQVLETVQFDEIAETAVPKNSALEIVLRTGGRLVLYTHRATQIQAMIQKYIVEAEKGSVEFVRGVADHQHRDPSVLNFRKGDIIKILSPEHYVEKGWLYGASGDRRGNFPCDLVEPLSREELISAQNAVLYLPTIPRSHTQS
ncbi:hypothetical protein RUM43_004780 [Polyplax serrata]|uniref:Unconventional myosin-XV n=1 Tax=Polyplax serrata TaxID=468196 RepID=A0AAN8SB82_POLSC